MRNLTDTGYHMFLRTAALTFALVLLFDSGLVNPATRILSLNAQSYMEASVGLSASVTPTQLNQYTAALTAKEQQLNQQEQQLKQREIAINAAAQRTGTGFNYSTYLLSIIVFVLLVLIMLNYVLDFVRARRNPTAAT